MNFNIVDKIIQNALNEDMPYGDITSEVTVGCEVNYIAKLVAKEEGILAGIEVFKRVFYLIDKKVVVDIKIADGNTLKKGILIAVINGPARSILAGERVALNLLQKMSGIATETKKYVELLKGTKVKIADTRKTTPGLRIIEKYAVKIGGGFNHRYSLSDAVMIKDNHIKAAGGIKKAVEKAKAAIPHTMKIEIEVETYDQFNKALNTDVDIILLDNMGIDLMQECVTKNNGKVILEASGNVTQENILTIAKTGVDVISSGALTHSVKALDISLKF